ncbi:MAG: glycosyltransferase family 2 protein [Lentisphaeria bacterium]|jgi:rhamnosyltransferase
MPAISIIIRAHNDAAYLPQVLAGLRRQHRQDFELIACDDRSSDNSAELLRSWPGVTMLPPEPNGYVPGKVLNRAVRAAHGDIVVFNNADAIILDECWLAELIAPLADVQVAAVYARQLPRPDAWPMVLRDHEQAFGDKPQGPGWRHFFSLASAAARRDLLLAMPFSETLQYSEDVDWTWRLRKEGWLIRYAPKARVEHSHNYPPAALVKRFYNEGLADAAIYGDKSQPLRACLKAAADYARDLKYCIAKRHWTGILSAAPYRFRQKLAHDRGLRDYRPIQQ